MNCTPDEVDTDTGDGYRVLFSCGTEAHGDGDWRVADQEHVCPDVGEVVSSSPPRGHLSGCRSLSGTGVAGSPTMSEVAASEQRAGLIGSIGA